MITKDLKPIPNYIVDKIRKLDIENRLLGNNNTTYYSYMTKFKGDLTQVVVACKTKDKQWLCKQIVVRSVHSDICYVRDIEYSLFGYTTGWYYQGITNNKRRYDDKQWYDAQDKYYNVYSPIINKRYILKQPQYKYSAVDKYPYLDIIKYLRIYEQYPQAEYLLKMDLPQFATNKTILKQISKDRNFRKWIIKNKEVLQNKYGNYPFFTARVILNAYKKNIPLCKEQYLDRRIRELNEDYTFKYRLQEIINNNEIITLIDYLDQNQIDLNTYWDYISACKNLNLDMTQEIKFPKDFKRLHDLRIDEYQKAKLLADEKERKELYKTFKQVAKKYLSLQRELDEDYIVVIAKSPADLIKEGNALDHCVGKMNYDQKFAREETLIFFVRNKDNPKTPFVTLEYSLTNHKILQCYAQKDSKPTDNVLNFVNKKWLPYANRKIKKVA